MVKKKKEELPEQYELLEVLKTSFYSVEGRDKHDRYKEFNLVFMDTDEGKRVLYEILAMAKLSSSIITPFPQEIDTNRMLVLEGKRQLAMDILGVLSKEPNTEKPKEANKRRK